MTAPAGTENAAPGQNADPAESGTDAGQTPVEQAPEQGANTNTSKSLEDLLSAIPDADREVVLGEVRKARNEAKGLRDRLKDSDPEKIKQSVVAELAKVLGVTDEAPDPAKLASDLENERKTAAGVMRENAVLRHAAAAGGNANALLDSVTFQRAIAEVDPTDSEAVSEAIKAAVAANPALAADKARRVPAPNPAAGSSANGAPSIDALIAEAEKKGDVQAVIALQNKKLAAQR